MTCFAFIFARGGSKGLPGKNLKPLLGKPLLRYAIETAQACSSIDRVFVSTEDKAIAEHATEAGATLIPRPPELATDTSPEWLSWRHAIQWAKDHYGHFDEFVSLPTTCPLRDVEDVEAALIKRQTEQADICISVTPANRSPYFNMVKEVPTDHSMELVISPAHGISRRQDAPEVYDITTGVYATTPEFIEQHSAIFDGKVVAIVMPKHRAVDIDDIYDFKLAQSILMDSHDE